jgi:hypothetical protein
MGWWDFVNANAAAMFGLAGTLSGAMVTGFMAWKSKQSEYSLAAAGKILDRRIAAHESVLALAMEMRAMGTLAEANETGEVKRMPILMLSRDDFEGFMTRFAKGATLATSWLELKREVYFVQDYLAALHMHLQRVPSKDFPDLGAVVQRDFVKLSSDLEKCLFQFFEKDLRSMRPAGPRGWHKYKRQQTETRLQATALFQKADRFVTRQTKG